MLTVVKRQHNRKKFSFYSLCKKGNFCIRLKISDARLFCNHQGKDRPKPQGFGLLT